MPLDISTDGIIEKNKMNSSGVWLLLVKIAYKSEDPVRLCLNNVNVTWDSQVWYPAIFSLSGITETKDGDVQSAPLTIVDFNGVIIPLLEQYKGAVGADVDIYVVHSDHLSNTSPEVWVDAEVLAPSLDGNHTVTFRLGTVDLSSKRCPSERYLKNSCRFAFKGADGRCGYSGSETVCDRTFARCSALGNQMRYGGFPGVGRVGYLK